ncbi:MAG: riboflavin synthase alpha chain [Segetibacter sp.]|nr:riboflavin synthase alpha chain [Segetibacter sp.]
MFTGIIESIGIVKAIENHGSNTTYWISSSITKELKIDQSLSHNGVCLTVEEISEGEHRVTAIAETLLKTNAGTWQPGTLVNLERCLSFNGRLDGHLVQGHVDTTATCTKIKEMDGSKEFTIEFATSFAPLVIEKGSISLNGISLTIFNITHNAFTVAIIPYTLEHTNMQQLKEGDTVNLEFDMVGKYINRFHELKKQ